MTYQDKVALVTGGASGIGAALCTALVTRGCRVIVVDVESDKAEALAAQLGDMAQAMSCDVSDAEAVEALAEATWRSSGGIDFVFANAGIGLGAPLLKSTLQQYEATMGVNLRGVWATSTAFARRMLADGRKGHICLTGSEHSLGLQHIGNGIYTASKHAVLGLGDVLRAELEGQVGVSVLCPGLVATNIVNSQRHYEWADQNARSKTIGEAVMARGLAPEVIAEETLQAIAHGDFLIVTHPTAHAAARRRWEAIDHAFATQPPQDGSRDHLDVTDVVANVLSDMKPSD